MKVSLFETDVRASSVVALELFEQSPRGGWDLVSEGEANTEKSAILVAQTLWDEQLDRSKAVSPQLRLTLSVGDKTLRTYTARP